MRYLSLAEILTLHSEVIFSTGGGTGIRDLGALESAIAQPRATFDATDFYPDILSKAAVLGFGIIANHPLVDGIKVRGKNKLSHYFFRFALDLAVPIEQNHSNSIAISRIL